MKLTGNNLIIVNVLATYVRILFIAAVGLFSTRWVLSALGKEDFGLYSVVGGLIIFILFIGNTMAVSVQRFYAYAIGQGDFEEVKKWFNSAFVLHVAFSIILVIVGIPLGDYLLDYLMQIPVSKLTTCHYVYYLSILGAVGTMLTTPYMGMFYAKQRIFEISLWGTLQATLMFILALYLLKAKGDLLLLYAIGIVGIKLLLDLIQIVRAIILFNGCRIRQKYLFLKKHVKELLFFSGWNFFSTLGSVIRNQGIAFLINVFSGAKVNAAFGVANQIASQTNQISSAFYQAVTPEIVRREGSGQRKSMISLAIRTSKFAMLLTFLWLIPLLIETDYILSIWLENVPEYTSGFCRIVLLTFALDKLTIGYTSAINGYGKVAGFQLTLGILLIITFPLTWGALKLDFSPIQSVSIMIFTSAACMISRAIWLKILINVPISLWVYNVLFKCLIVAVPTFLVLFVSSHYLDQSILRLIITFLISSIMIVFLSYTLSFDNVERGFIREKIARFCIKHKK